MQNSIVNTQHALLSLCDKISQSNLVAIDTEFLRDKTYYGKLCLIQIATDDVITCVDPLHVENLEPLLECLYEPGILKIMHSARQDLELFYDLTGKVPQPVYDTQIAATLLGYGDQTGYAKLVKSLMSVNLDKSHARTDWSQRPLDDSQIEYALDDVRYLIPMYRKQWQMLIDKGRTSWLDDDFRRLTDLSLYCPDQDDLWTRVKGARNMKGVQLAVLQRLAIWREDLAKQLDRPRRWLLSDDMLVELAKRQPLTVAALEKIRGCNSHVKKNARKLFTVIGEAKNLPKEAWPKDNRPDNLSLEQEALVDFMMGIVRVRAMENEVTAAVLTTRKDLEKLVLGETEFEMMHGWRNELIGRELRNFLNGNETIRVQNNHIVIDSID